MGFIAIASISTLAPFGRAATWIVERAGGDRSESTLRRPCCLHEKRSRVSMREGVSTLPLLVLNLDFFGRRQAPSGSCFSQRQPSLPGNIRDRERERRRQQRSTGTGTCSHLTTSRQVSFLPGGKCRVAASLVAVSARNTALPFTSDAPMISNRSVCPVRSTTVIA